MSYLPSYLSEWTMPDNYYGKQWPDYYVFLGQHRDSDALTRSNFRVAINELNKISNDIIIVTENHWAVGWVEWIAIHKNDNEALKLADKMMEELADYPVLDDNDYSELEYEEANDIWSNCFNYKNRIDHIRKYESEFYFESFKDMLNQVRGKYYSGNPSNILY